MNTRWSYKVLELKPRLFGGKMTERAQQELEKLGLQGWELVAATPANGLEPIRLFLKKAY